MSQKERSFQSKPKRGGQKFGDANAGGRGRGRPAGRSFGERSESARPPRRDYKAEGQREYKPEGFTPRDSRPPRRDYKPRDAGGDRPYQKREFGEKKPYQKREYAGRDETRREYKPEGFGSGAARTPRRDEGRREYKAEGRREYKPRDAGGDRPYQKREFGEKKPYEKREYGDKKPYDKEKRFDKFNSRPQKSYERYDEKPARKEFDRQKLKSERPAFGAPSSAFLYGVHAVSQALLNPRRIHQRLLCTEKGEESLQETWAAALDKGIALPQIITVEKEDIERLLPRDAVHQDVLLDCQPLADILLADLLETPHAENAKILVLDQVTDPHNVGAILRSAAAFGALAVVMQKLHAPEITGVLAKAASGAVEHVPLVREVNLSRALEQLKEAGFFCIGLAEEGQRTLAEQNLTGKTALVLGAEGAGLRRLVAENCDELVKLPTQGPIGSLNVSNAAVVALYELVRSSEK